MSKENGRYCNFIRPDKNGDWSEVAQQIEEWTTTSGAMLPKPAAEAEDLLSSGKSVLAVKDGKVIGCIAVTFEHPREDGSVGAAEVGMLYADADHRGHGVGGGLIDEMVDSAEGMYDPTVAIITVANAASEPLFRSRGAQEMDHRSVPVTVWEACATCPNKPEEGGCCDTLLNLRCRRHSSNS